MRGGQIAAAGLGGAVTGDTTAWLWNDVLPWLLSAHGLPEMPPGVAGYIGAAILGGLVYLVSWLPRAGTEPPSPPQRPSVQDY